MVEPSHPDVVESLPDPPDLSPPDANPKADAAAAPAPAPAPATWADVTAVFDRAGAQLGPGELVHSADFTLQGAMCASDVGDARMDPGLGAGAVASVAERRAAGALRPDAALSPAEALHVADYLTRALGAWLGGSASLAQSVYTCLYAHDAARELRAPHVRAVVCAAVRECAGAMEAVREAGVCAEEDVCLQLPGFGPMDEVPSAQALADELARAEDEHRREQHHGRRDPVADALCARLRVHRTLLQLHVALDSLRLDAARRAAKAALAALEHAAEGAELAQEPAGAYEPRIAMRVEAPAVLRGAELPELADAVAVLRRHVEGLARACAVPLDAGGVDLLRLLHWTLQFSETSPDVFARSWLLRALRSPECSAGASMAERVSRSLLAFPLPAAWVRDAESAALIEHLAGVWEVTFETVCSNRSRMRRKTFELLRHWDAAQSVAIEVDQLLAAAHPLPPAPPSAVPSSIRSGGLFMGYASSLKLLFMALYLQLGFELGLFAPREYAVVFWYLDFLLGMRRSQYIEIRAVSLLMARKVKAKPQKAGKKGREAPQPPVEDPDVSCPLLYLMEAEFFCTRATFRMVSALLAYGAAKKAEPVYGSEEALFEYRFRVFQYFMIPQPLTFQNWVETGDFRKFSGDALINGALDSFKACKAALVCYSKSIVDMNEIPLIAPPKVQSWTRLLVVNMLNIQLIQSNPDRNSKEFTVDNAPVYDWSLCPSFPTITLPKIRRI
eukprot:m51a1_g13805 hypothetical protein (731) ;mRNA; r:387264-389809